MRVKVKFRLGYIRFAYAVGNHGFGYFSQAHKESIETNEPVYLTGYYYNVRHGCSELIDEKEIIAKPTVSQVKKFMKDCINIIKESYYGCANHD